MTMTKAMREAMRTIRNHEDAGYIGAPRSAINPRTSTALTRRGWIEPCEDGSIKLTEMGRRVA